MFCNKEGILNFIGNPRKNDISHFLNLISCDVLISINYLFLIEQNLIKIPEIIAFNVHGSLLPKYRGRTPHVWSIINNEKKTGITAHIIDTGCDTGNIIEQIEIPIENNDTGASLLKKYEKLYFSLILRVLKKVKDNTLITFPQDNSKATYFGKRNSEDGLINWNWQRERIYNWIRAQTFPYPGAFTYYFNNKVIIDWIVFDDNGFDYNTENGTIVSIDPIRVKTPNGLIKITMIRNTSEYFVVNNKFENI